MSEYLVQIVFFAAGLLVQIIVPFVKPKAQKILAAVIGSGLILFSTSWIFYTLGKKQAPPKTFNWPANIDYFDFELAEDQQAWHATKISLLTRSTDKAFTGNYSLALSTQQTGELPEDYIFAYWNHPFQAEAIIGQVYWPQQLGARVTWAQICIQDEFCTRIPIKYDRWNTFAINLYDSTDDNGNRYSQKELKGLYLQGGVNIENEEQKYTFYIDGIQIFNFTPVNSAQ